MEDNNNYDRYENLVEVTDYRKINGLFSIHESDPEKGHRKIVLDSITKTIIREDKFP